MDTIAIDVIGELMRRGANINSVDVNGHTPLHIAVFMQRISAVKQLVLHGADLDAEDQACSPTRRAQFSSRTPHMAVPLTIHTSPNHVCFHSLTTGRAHTNRCGACRRGGRYHGVPTGEEARAPPLGDCTRVRGCVSIRPLLAYTGMYAALRTRRQMGRARPRRVREGVR